MINFVWGAGQKTLFLDGPSIKITFLLPVLTTKFISEIYNIGFIYFRLLFWFSPFSVQSTVNCLTPGKVIIDFYFLLTNTYRVRRFKYLNDGKYRSPVVPTTPAPVPFVRVGSRWVHLGKADVGNDWTTVREKNSLAEKGYDYGYWYNNSR
jgi:hypothetical protein